MGTFKVQVPTKNVDQNLLSWLGAAAQNSPYNVVVHSGTRGGDPRFHGKAKAFDVALVDPKTGKWLDDYQNASTFGAYQGFANLVRGAQMRANPELGKSLRWGGYFSGGKGKYGALDLMHFDTGGDTVGMAGGSWDSGLTPQQAAIWGLQPGGGFTGSGSVAPVFDGSVSVGSSPLLDPDYGRGPPKFDLSGLGQDVPRRAAVRKAKAAQGPQETPQQPQPTFDPGAKPAVSAGLPDALPGPLEGTGQAPLAELFKLGDIGQAGIASAAAARQNPYAPPRRRES